LHLSLTDSCHQAEQSSLTTNTQLKQTSSSPSTDVFAGTAFAAENLQSLGIYYQEIASSMVQVSSLWLKNSDTNRSLVTGIDSRILLVAVQALAVMQLPVNDPLYALLDRTLHVSPSYQPSPTVTVPEASKKKASRGKAAKQAAKAAVISKAHIPNDVWVLLVSTAIQNMQKGTAGASSVDIASQRGLVTALLTLQKGTGSTKPAVQVEQTVKAQLNQLIDMLGSELPGSASGSLTSNDCMVLLKACLACVVGNPVSLTSHYFNLELKQVITHMSGCDTSGCFFCLALTTVTCSVQLRLLGMQNAVCSL
jgi:hypothetical protein